MKMSNKNVLRRKPNNKRTNESFKLDVPHILLFKNLEIKIET